MDLYGLVWPCMALYCLVWPFYGRKWHFIVFYGRILSFLVVIDPNSFVLVFPWMIKALQGIILILQSLILTFDFQISLVIGKELDKMLLEILQKESLGNLTLIN